MSASPTVRRLLAGLCLALPLALSACGDDPASGGAPTTRLVLVTLDTLRADAFTPELMPRLSALAAGGRVYSQAYSATSSTQPTHASMFTGLHPWQHGVTRNGVVLPDEALTVAELLSDAGWSTAAVVASFPLERRFAFTQGYDVYVDEFDEQDRKTTWNDEQVAGGHFYSLADAITERALAQLDAQRGARQHLWVHYYDPHAPYGDGAGAPDAMEQNELLQTAKKRPDEVPARLARARELYEADVRHLDAAIGRLLDRLAADDGVATHVLFTADHGESFGENGSFGHGKRVTREEVHVPLVIAGPDVPAGSSDAPAGSVDVGPTLLDLAGLDPDLLPGGRSLLRPANGAAVFGMRRSFASPGQDVRTDGTVVVVEGTRFFHVRAGRMVIGNGEAIVDSEFTDDEAARLDDVREVFAVFEAELQGRDVTELVDAETQARLEAIGYTR